MSKVRILSIDGGGIRGILPGTLLAYLEERLRVLSKRDDAHIGEFFDFIVGTSTGGILSLVYLCPGADGGFKYTARQALDIYLEQGDEIFDVTLGHKIQNLGGLTDEKYDEKELEEALGDYLGDTTLSKALKPCLITSYDIRNRKAFFFSSVEAAASSINDFYMRDVARATSAAPTYFEPARIKSIYGTPHSVIDGGVFANNPALCAYAEARTLNFQQILDNPQKPDKPGATDMVMVSLGTGGVKKPYYFKEFQDAGVIKWIRPLIDIMMSGNSETVDYQLKQIYKTLNENDCKDYFRIQPEIINANPEMDCASIENLQALYEDGLTAVANNKEVLDKIAERLWENR